MMHSPTIRSAFAFLFISSFIISVNESCTKSGLTDRATSSVKPRTVGSSQFAISSVDLDRVRIFAHFLVDPRPREPSRARVNMLGDREEWGCSCNQQMSHCMLMKSDTVMSYHSTLLSWILWSLCKPGTWVWEGMLTFFPHSWVSVSCTKLSVSISDMAVKFQFSPHLSTMKSNTTLMACID